MKSAEEFLRQLDLHSGSETVPAKQDVDTDADSFVGSLSRQIESKAVALLAIREHGAKELKAKLLAKFPETSELLEQAQEPPGLLKTLVDDVIERCRENNWQSDQRYIEQAVSSLMEKGQGPLKIRQKLQQACDDSSQIEASLDLDPEDWLAVMREVLLKKYGELDKPQQRNEQAKRMRFLQSRGFPAEWIWKVYR
ncbi:regulatory protein RecX [Thiomicrorhabdus sp. ZW0627]|uniref:regulatory protein RecX n=1 Tax=Thiomicrorhabdus sp. ZW0627 TaxID=3039774 RepID=UPI0024367945|nr:regulatory protein RecX [Thiomicrorhabdus sp. ZW0627]MDG6773427.1 regulatory protein RecX [Thiomicrorhabdus sp. ZW0627]